MEKNNKKTEYQKGFEKIVASDDFKHKTIEACMLKVSKANASSQPLAYSQPIARKNSIKHFLFSTRRGIAIFAASIFLIIAISISLPLGILLPGNNGSTGPLANGTYRASGANGTSVTNQRAMSAAGFNLAPSTADGTTNDNNNSYYKQLTFEEHFNHPLLSGVVFSVNGETISAKEYTQLLMDEHGRGHFFNPTNFFTDEQIRDLTQNAMAVFLGHNYTDLSVFNNHQILTLLYLYARVLPYAETVFIVYGNQMTKKSRMEIPLNNGDWTVRDRFELTFEFSLTAENRIMGIHGGFTTSIYVEDGRIIWGILREGFYVVWERE